MAQRSKKNHIIQTALPLFLEHGFKGTSIDMVVKASGVSKPTVYNHFPDKSALMSAVLQQWVEDNKPVILPLHDQSELEEFIRLHWLHDEAIRLYAIVIGEGFRFAGARQMFWEQFDRRWRVACGYVCDQAPELERAEIEPLVDRLLLARLRAQ